MREPTQALWGLLVYTEMYKAQRKKRGNHCNTKWVCVLPL